MDKTKFEASYAESDAVKEIPDLSGKTIVLAKAFHKGSEGLLTLTFNFLLSSRRRGGTCRRNTLLSIYNTRSFVSFDSDFDRTEEGRKIPKGLLEGKWRG